MTERQDMRVSDAERQAIVDRLRVAMDEGRLDLSEYDARIGAAYSAVTYGDLDPLVADLPAASLTPSPGLPATSGAAAVAPVLSPGVVADMNLALKVLWTVWSAVVAVNLTVWLLVSVSTGEPVYFWPMWLLVPGVVLAGSTVGVHELRVRRRHGQALPGGRTAIGGGAGPG